MNEIAFIGCGGIASAHAYALSNLVYHYGLNTPRINKKYVSSRDLNKAKTFQQQFGFESSLTIDELFSRSDFDTLFILSPNSSHFEYLIKSIEHPNIKNIYIEKPICCFQEEIDILNTKASLHNKNIQVGFQFLEMSAIRQAYQLWNELDFGKLVHFNARYLHSSYLEKSYRDKRKNRLVEAPIGGALADLGSHVFSILVKFIGNGLQVKSCSVSGQFADVPKNSDLCTLVTLTDTNSQAIGTVTASRISYGSGDQLEFELFANNGAIRFSSLKPDYLTYSHQGFGSNWLDVECASKFPDSAFPNAHVPSGWLRSLIHAHYVFLKNDPQSSKTGLAHGIEVQRLILDSITNFKRYNNE